MTRPTWPILRDQLAHRVTDSGRTPAAIAEEIGISRPQLLNLVNGVTREPRNDTQEAVYRWLNGEIPGTARNAPIDRESSANYQTHGPGSHQAAEEDLLEYFLENHQQMATLMSRTSEGLSPEERRKVALALLNAFKRMAIEAGQKIPPFLYELERRFVEE